MSTVTNNELQKSNSTKAGEENFTVVFLTLQEMTSFEQKKQALLENMILNRPIRIFFEVDTSFPLTKAGDYFESRGYSLVSTENNDDYILAVLTRNDYQVLGFPAFSFNTFLSHKASDSKTYLSSNKAALENEFIESCKKLNDPTSVFTREEELSILDEFFN